MVVRDPSSSVIELLSFIVGLAGIAASVIFYFRAKEKPKPVFRGVNLPLIGGKSPLLPSDVEIVYRGDKVQSLSKAYAAFWNAGRGTILGSSVVADDPIRFKVADSSAKILSARIIQRTREVDKANLLFDEKEVQLNFDFLDPQDGVVLEVIHTGIDSYLECVGTIRGIPLGVRSLNRPSRLRRRLQQRGSTLKASEYVPIGFRRTDRRSTIVPIALSSIFPIIFALVGFSLANATKSAIAASLRQRSTDYASSGISASDVHFVRLTGLVMLLVSVAILAILVGLGVMLPRHQLPKRLVLTEDDITDRMPQDISTN